LSCARKLKLKSAQSNDNTAERKREGPAGSPAARLYSGPEDQGRSNRLIPHELALKHVLTPFSPGKAGFAPARGVDRPYIALVI
jgi:hypothetical protein